MAITINTALRTTRGQTIITDAGANARLTVYTAGYATVLYTSICAATLGTMAGAVLTFNAVADAIATGTGTAAIARLFRSDGTTMVLEGFTVGLSGTDIIIANPIIAINDTITTGLSSITEGGA